MVSLFQNAFFAPVRKRLAASLFLISALAFAPMGHGQARTTGSFDDSPEPLFTARDALWAGGFVVGTVVLAPVDLAVAHAVRDSLFQESPWLRPSARAFGFLGLPGALVLSGGMYALGQALDRPGLADIGLHTTEAIVIAEVITGATKVLAGRSRPSLSPDDPYDFRFARGLRGDAYQSFPSGHAAAAFATAAAVTSEVSEQWPGSRILVGSALYAGATLVGVSRLYHNRHWASDVMMGAAIGTFAGWKTVAYTHDRPTNRLDRWLLGVSVTPGASENAVSLWVMPSSAR